MHQLFLRILLRMYFGIFIGYFHVLDDTLKLAIKINYIFFPLNNSGLIIDAEV